MVVEEPVIKSLLKTDYSTHSGYLLFNAHQCPVHCPTYPKPIQIELEVQLRIGTQFSNSWQQKNLLLAVHGIDPAAAILTQPNGCTNLYPTPRIRASSSSSSSSSAAAPAPSPKKTHVMVLSE